MWWHAKSIGHLWGGWCALPRTISLFSHCWLYLWLLSSPWPRCSHFCHCRLCDIRLTSFVYHRIRSLTQSVGSMLWSMAQLRRGQLRMVVYVVGMQLLMMWSAVCSGSPHSHAALSARPHFFMDALYRPTPVRSLFKSRSVFSAQIFSLDAFSWVRYVAVYSGGSGCFPLLLPHCRNPCVLRPVLGDDT